MELNNMRLGSLIEPFDERCATASLTAKDISGINATKEFFEPARQVGKDTSNYRNVPPGFFVCNLMHVGRDAVLPIALNRSSQTKIVSPAYSVFRLKPKSGVLNEYLFMTFNSPERDRYFWFHTDASVRDGMSWSDFCECMVSIPELSIQRKYVAVYEAMLANQRTYESGLDDLKLSRDALVERLIREAPHETIAPYIEQSDARNTQGIGASHVRGLSINKHLTETKASLDGVNLSNYKVIQPYELTYVPVTSHNGNKLSIAMNESDDVCITSAINTASHIKADAIDKLLPGYLMLFFGRAEFDRYARFSSWGSARETFDWSEMCDVRIPIPDISVQRYAVALYDTWRMRTKINERFKSGLKEICPILIRGSIEEALL